MYIIRSEEVKNGPECPGPSMAMTRSFSFQGPGSAGSSDSGSTFQEEEEKTKKRSELLLHCILPTAVYRVFVCSQMVARELLPATRIPSRLPRCPSHYRMHCTAGRGTWEAGSDGDLAQARLNS